MIIGNEKEGFYDLNNKEDVEKVHSKYLLNPSLRKLALILNSNKRALSKAFQKYGFSYLSRKEANQRYFKTVPKKIKPKKDRVKTCLERYGVCNPRQNKEINAKIIEKRTKSYLERLNKKLKEAECEMLEDFTRVQDKNGKYVMYTMKHKCGYIFKTDLRRDIKCPKCYHINRFSKLEITYKDFVKSLNVDAVYNKKIIPNYELDIFCPDLMIGIEINGSYWHSVEKKGRNYHSEKTKAFLEKGIKVYNFWDYQDPEIIKSMITARLHKTPNTMYARKLKLKKITTEEAREFLDSNHLDGYTKSSICLALENCKGDIISVIAARRTSGLWEISRFANRINHNVCGGFSRLFKHLIEEIKKIDISAKTIISYCNRDVAPSYEDTVYFKNGFTFLGDSGSILKYYNKKKKKVESRQVYQKHKLPKILSKFDNRLTADENLINNNVFPIRNSGNWKFEFTIN